ncbi:hypothetical protein GCM10017691_31500 [Pseudonocardia petroleophila]
MNGSCFGTFATWVTSSLLTISSTPGPTGGGPGTVADAGGTVADAGTGATSASAATAAVTSTVLSRPRIADRPPDVSPDRPALCQGNRTFPNPHAGGPPVRTISPSVA